MCACSVVTGPMPRYFTDWPFEKSHVLLKSISIDGGGVRPEKVLFINIDRNIGENNYVLLNMANKDRIKGHIWFKKISNLNNYAFAASVYSDPNKKENSELGPEDERATYSIGTINRQNNKAIISINIYDCKKQKGQGCKFKNEKDAIDKVIQITRAKKSKKSYIVFEEQ